MPQTWTRIHAGQLSLVEHHKVQAVQGNRVTLREPVKAAVKAKYGWQLTTYPHIAEVGVEDISFQGGWLGKYIHHRSWMDDNGWQALRFANVVDSWVRRCTFVNLSQCLGFESCASITALHNTLAGTMGHVSIGNPRRCTGMLFGLSQDRMERQTKDTTHGIGAAGSAVGTVYWRYTMHPDQQMDMHGMYPYATLFDRVTGGNLAGSGGPIPAFPNHLQQFVVWNFRHTKPPTGSGYRSGQYDFWGGRPSLVKPLIIGMHGTPARIDETTVAVNESPGQPVEPESLYEAQLRARFKGRLPAWVGKAREEWARVQENLPEFPRGGDNTPWVARKRQQIIQLILDTPMRKDLYDANDPREALLKQWPTADGRPWVSLD